MTTAVGGDERLITIHGRGVGETADSVVQAAQERGYSVAATGPGQFRMIREKRPTWAIVVAIVTFPILGLGLLFLLVKKVDSGSVAVFEGRDGTKVRFVGGIDQEIVDSASGVVPKPGGLEGSRGEYVVGDTSEPVGHVESMPTSRERVAPEISESTNGEPITRSPSAVSSSSPGHSGGSPALIDRSPINRNPSGRSESSGPSVEMTVARQPSHAAASIAVAIAFPDSRSVPLSKGLVIGRSPTPPRGMEALSVLPYPDDSLSKTHLAIEPSASGATITDLHSTNGTVLINGDETVECPAGEAVSVAVGARIYAGDVLLRVERVR